MLLCGITCCYMVFPAPTPHSSLSASFNLMEKKIPYLDFCGVFAFLEKSANLLPFLPALYLTPGPTRVAQLRRAERCLITCVLTDPGQVAGTRDPVRGLLRCFVPSPCLLLWVCGALQCAQPTAWLRLCSTLPWGWGIGMGDQL